MEPKNTTNVEDLEASRKRQENIEKLERTKEMLELQAEVAELRTRIVKASLEEILYSLKIHELKTAPTEAPTEEKQPSNEQPGENKTNS